MSDISDLVLQAKITNRLLAAQLRSSMQQNELVALLASTGASNRDIADVLDTTPDVIRMTMKRAEAKSKGKHEKNTP